MSEYISFPNIVDSFREVDERIADIVIGPAPAWQTPTFENGWVNYGSGFAPATYTRDMVGWVHLRGLVKSGTLGVNVFVLPAGFRPGARTMYPLITNSGVGRLDIWASGAVWVVSGGNEYVGLDGISFLGER